MTSLAEWTDAGGDLGRPGAAPQGFAVAKQRLMDLSLLAPVRFADDEEGKFLVHRWTAGALAKRASEDEQTAAHRGAAEYWRWRVDKRRKRPPKAALPRAE